MSATILRADSRALPLEDATVDLVVTSPPYFALRSYTDGGEHYAGQVGDEATPQEFLEALWTVTAECMRVLKPSGSLWVNLGDKYGDRKSLLGLPWRYALGCIDNLGLILRAEVIWSKPNGLPESVTDRVRRSHEQWFHFTKEPRYFSAVDEVREPHAQPDRVRADVFGGASSALGVRHAGASTYTGPTNPLGKLPGSVWTVPTEPLRVPDHLGVDHFAAFPTEFPRRIITGWSPSGVCVECGEGRAPIRSSEKVTSRPGHNVYDQRMPGRHPSGNQGREGRAGDFLVTITGYTCACPTPDAATRPAVVLDPFGGTGTTALVASVLGRHGISVDLSADYCRLAQWRTTDPDQRAKALRVEKPPPVLDGQLDMFGEVSA